MHILFLINEQKQKKINQIKKYFLIDVTKQNHFFSFQIFNDKNREKVFNNSLKTKSNKIIVIDEYDNFAFMFFSKQVDYFCANPYNAKLAKLAIMHNNANVLAIGYKTICWFKIKKIISNFLYSLFEGGRHLARLENLHNSFESTTHKNNFDFTNHNDSIIIACDHAGLNLKNQIFSYLTSKHFHLIDVGTYSNMSCNYSTYGIKLGQTMLKDGQKGIVICGSGMGICNTINKFYYLRCINAYCKPQLLNALQYDINVLGFGGRFISFNKAKKLIDIFLKQKMNNKDNCLKHCGLELKK